MLGIPVKKEQDASSRLCFKCKREMEKLETLSKCMKNFREKAQQSLQYQKNLFDSGIQDRIQDRSTLPEFGGGARAQSGEERGLISRTAAGNRA